MDVTQDVKASLDDLLAEPAAPSIEAAHEPIHEASPQQVETGDKPQLSAPPAEAKTDPAQVKDDGPVVPRRALEDERRKRQENEKALEDLQRKFSELQTKVQPVQQQHQAQQQIAPPPPPPDPWTDPEGAMRYQQEQFQDQLYQTRLYASEEVLRSQKPDYDEYAQMVGMAAQTNQSLARAIFNHPFPAKFVYETGRKMKLMQEIGNDPDAYQQRIISDWQAKQQAQAQPQSQPEAQKLSVPKSLAGTPSAQPRNSKGQWQGPASLDDLLGG